MQLSPGSYELLGVRPDVEMSCDSQRVLHKLIQAQGHVNESHVADFALKICNLSSRWVLLDFCSCLLSPSCWRIVICNADSPRHSLLLKHALLSGACASLTSSVIRGGTACPHPNN